MTYDASNEVQANINKITTQFSYWNKNLYKGLQKRKHVRIFEDMQKFPTPEEIKRMDNSDIVNEAKACLDMMKNNYSEPSKQEFTLIRDYIMTMLIFDNCSRPGGIYNMLLSEMGKCYEEVNGGCSVKVFNHKTAYKGPVNIFVNKTVWANSNICLP